MGVEMDRDEDRYKRTSNILEKLRGISFAFDHLKDFRKQYRDALPEFKKLEKTDKDKFIQTYAYVKVQVIDEYDGLEDDEEGGDRSVDSDSDGTKGVDGDDDGGEGVSSEIYENGATCTSR